MTTLASASRRWINHRFPVRQDLAEACNSTSGDRRGIAHGHAKDIDRPLSFEQDADDVAVPAKQLHIEKVDVRGFSNGEMTSLQIAIRHPQLVE